MKKIILASMILLFASVSGMANITMGNDTVVPKSPVRYLSTKLGQNWFINVNGSINWWQGSDLNPAGNYTTLNGPTFGGGVSAGKWITHNLAIRVAYDINRSHSYIDGTHSAVAEDKAYSFLYDNNPTPDENGYCTTTFLYHNLHADVLFSPIDLLQGYYNPDRFFTPIIFAGMGVACASGEFSVIQSYLDKKYNFEFSAEFLNLILSEYFLSEPVCSNYRFGRVHLTDGDKRNFAGIPSCSLAGTVDPCSYIFKI